MNTTAKDVFNWINQIAPFSDAESWDNSGFLLGRDDASADPLGLALDMTPQVLSAARAAGISTVLTHHPVIFHPLSQAREGEPVYEILRAGVSVICAHTNLDKCPFLGTNRVLADILGIWTGELSPTLENCGVIGSVAPCTAKALSRRLQEALSCPPCNVLESEKLCRRVAVVAGSGGSLLSAAHEAGADTLITGDVKQDVWVQAQWLGMNLIEVRHFDLENPVFAGLTAALERDLKIKAVWLSKENPVTRI